MDVTNNANPHLFNVMLHLPDDVAAIALVEDHQFVLVDFMRNYRSNDGSNEYFYKTGRFYAPDRIAWAIARDIRETGSATLRTDARLCDFQFGLISLEVALLLGDFNLYGTHWLGVIWMSAESS